MKVEEAKDIKPLFLVSVYSKGHSLESNCRRSDRLHFYGVCTCCEDVLKQRMLYLIGRWTSVGLCVDVWISPVCGKAESSHTTLEYSKVLKVLYQLDYHAPPPH